jgi:diguanylate cyclase (GGDEF)-like protein
MNNKPNKLNLNSRSLNVKLMVAFVLSSIIPILILMNMIFPSLFNFTFKVNEMQPLKFNILPILIITIAIAAIGFYILKRIIDPVIKISREASHIAEGNFDHVIKVGIGRDDEIGDLSSALDKLTLRIRQSMEELSNYGEKTKNINTEIHKRVVILSNLLQIGNLISQGSKLEEILKVSVDKIMQVGQSELGLLLTKAEDSDFLSLKCFRGQESERISNLKVRLGEGLLGNVIHKKEVFILDKNNKQSSADIRYWQESFGMRNAIFIPLYVRGKALGLICIANNKEDFFYTTDDLEILEIFVKQIAIALETDFLHFRVQKLEVKDPLTGLYNERFIKARLDEEIKRAVAYQRPCAFLLFNVDNFRRYHTLFGELASETALKKIALTLEDSVTEIDRVARFGDNDFAVVLPERNKKEALKIAEEIRKKLEYLFKEETEVNKRLTMSGGVSENPIDGVSSGELIDHAREMLDQAKAHGKNLVKA